MIVLVIVMWLVGNKPYRMQLWRAEGRGRGGEGGGGEGGCSL